MPRSTWALSVAFAPFFLLLSSPAHAGSNAGGTIRLSWDEAGQISNLASVSPAPFPLYAHIAGAPDVRALAVELRWFPFDSIGAYRIIPATPSASCGGASPVPPGEDFKGDSSYTWSFTFAPTTTLRNCVLYSVSGVLGQQPADFVVGLARVLDSGGRVDTLIDVGNATVLGGTATAVTVLGVEPKKVLAGQQAVLAVRGLNFQPGARLELDGAGVHVNPSSVTVTGSNTLTATVAIPNVPGAVLSAAVTLPDRRRADLHQALTLSSPILPMTTAAANTPTDDGSAYRRFDLYADRTLAVNATDHVNISAYPSFLNSNALLVTRSPGDTVALFNSEPYDGINLRVDGGAPESYVQYAVTPPQYASSIGLLAMAFNVFNSTGEFNDLGKLLLTVLATYADGDTLVRGMLVGYHLRDWAGGSLNCGGTRTFYTIPPSHPLAGVVYSDTVGKYYYDVQEIALPHAKQGKKLTAIRLSAELEGHPTCFIYSGDRLHGLSAWTKFSIVNGATSVVLQTQYNPTWAADAYGGYVYNDTLIGQHRTIGEFGCFTACLSMANNYYGVPCTPRALNQFLQRRRDGHFFRAVAQVTGVTGNTVTFSLLPGSGTVGPTFLIERGRNAPLATVGVQSITGSTGTGTITQRFRGGTVVIGDFGVVYDEDNYFLASKGFSNRVWQVTGLKPKPGDTIAALAESTMASDTPVFLYTGIDTSGATHWVVAEGREPAFVSASIARGTYRIKDPGYRDLSSQPIRRLLQAPHNNLFQDALVCSLLTTHQAQDAVVDTLSGQALALRVQGTATLEITDPNGNTITYDPVQDRYTSGIPNAVALRRFNLVSPGDPSVRSGISDIIQVPDAATARIF